jgi:hypothetical protein
MSIIAGSSNVESIGVTLDLLSSGAFYEDRVRISVWKEPFTHFLPLMLNKEHAGRSFPHLENTFRQFSVTPTFEPLTALKMMTAIMSSMVVRFMESAESERPREYHSEKALSGYCAFHHMILSFARRYPIIREKANEMVSEFLRNPQKRIKKSVPNLGNLLSSPPK